MDNDPLNYITGFVLVVKQKVIVSINTKAPVMKFQFPKF